MCADRTRPASSPKSFARRPDGRLDLWVCSRCGYVYDGAKGEPLSRTPPETAFETLPESWRCPHCTSEKEFFFH